jgi:hypothetical protein
MTDRMAGASWHVVPLGDELGWAAALKDTAHGLGHTWSYNAAMQESTGHRTLLYVGETSTGTLICPLAERGSGADLDIYTPLGFGGFVGQGDPLGLGVSWRDFVTRRGYVTGYLALHPVLTPSIIASEPGAQSVNTVFLLDLIDDPDELLSRMSESTRRRLRRWSETDTTITIDHDVLKDAFIRLFPPSMRSRNAGPAYDLSQDTLGRLCDAPGITLYGIPSDDPMAVVMIGSATGGIEYIHGVAEPAARSHIATLLWRAARDSARHGMRWLNLGGGIVANDSLAEFKRRLGGRSIPLVALRQVYDEERYRQLCAAAGSGLDDGYFPPYRAPRMATLRPQR